MSPPVPNFDDAAARQALRRDLDRSFIVEAAAGTGKTSELAYRLVEVLKSGRTTVDRVVAVTFTRKAAGEMKLRLRQYLDAAREAEITRQEKANLEHAIAHLEEAHIGTIHSFCAEILRERPVEARVDPGFQELSEDQAQALYERAFQAWIHQKLSDLPPALERALARGNRAESPLERLQAAGWKLAEWRDFPAPWRREAFDLRREADRLLERLRELAQMALQCPKTNDFLRQTLKPAVELVQSLERAEAVRARDYCAMETLLLELPRKLRKGYRGKGRGPFAAGLTRDQVLAARDSLLASLADFERRANAELASLLHDELHDLVERYEQHKRRAGKLDFVDLLILARNLVRDNAEVRRYLQQRFTHIFVDEFQDTDPLQAEILLLLASDDPEQTDWLRVRPRPGKLLLVGDPKQAIYRFRRADVLLYQAVAESLTARGVARLYLTTSFRAVEPLQEAINNAFPLTIREDKQAGQPQYVPLGKYWEGPDDQPSLIALPVPHPYGPSGVSREAIKASLPVAIAAFVGWLVRESGWKVRDPEVAGRRIPLAARHVAILFRHFVSWKEDLTRDVVRGLEDRGLPHVLVGARSFHRREEVETLRAALTAVEWPDDELAVFATLKGSLFAIPDEALLRFRQEVGRLHPFRPLPEGLEGELRPVAEALSLVADLHRNRNWRPVAETLNHLLEAGRAHAGFALRPAGQQVLANVQRVCELARSFEMAGGISFRGFVEQLEAEAEREETAGVTVLEEAAQGVRLMTVHSAKGLEFPVVILADLATNLARRDPERHIEPEQRLCALALLGCAPWDLLDHQDLERGRDQAEGVRIAYVAATRARDLLVVPAIGDREWSGWMAPLNPALYPAPASCRHPRTAAGCPAFGADTLLDRPTQECVKPGLHVAREGGHQVVWWDPAILRLGVQSNFGLHQEEILAEDPGGQAAGAGLEQYEGWRTRRGRSLQQGRQPQFDLLVASQALQAPPADVGLVEWQAVEHDPARPAGARFGTLVHTVLSQVNLAAEPGAIGALALLQGRVLGSPPQEVEAAARAVSAVLRHPLLQRARSARRLYRELPVTLRMHPDRILEGTVDLAFVEAGRWAVVDFKTDADIAARRQHYQRQLQWYMYAISQLSRLPVSGWLLQI